MSERHTYKAEASAESAANKQEAERRSRELLDEAKREAAEAKHHHKEQLNELRNELEQQAVSSKELRANTVDDQEPEAANTYWYSAEYRKQAYDQTLRTVRKKLTRSERATSKVIHQPLVERVSEIGSKTVARPSGVLVGSIASFVVSFIVYFVFKRYGYDMTYSIFIVSFLGGFLLGIVGEFSYKAVRALLARR